MQWRNKLLAASCLFAMGCGSLPLLSGVANGSELCEQQPSQSVQGVPAAVSAYAPRGIDQDIGFDASGILAQLSSLGSEANVQLSSLTLAVDPDGGVPDLSFLMLATVSVPAADGGYTEILRYMQTNETTHASAITATAEGDVNLLGLDNNGSVAARLHLEGQLPSADWAVSTKPCFKAAVSFEVK